MEKSVLWIAPKWPLPAHDGARIATTQLIRNLAQMDVSIDLACVIEPLENPNIELAKQVLGVEDVFLLRRGSPSHSGFRKYYYFLQNFIKNPNQPITIAPFAHSELKSVFSQIWSQNNHRWSTVVFDGLHTAALSSQGNRFQQLWPKTQSIYRAHNVEASLWEQAAQQTPLFPKRWFLKIQSNLVKKFENSLVETCEGIATVSEQDLARFNIHCPVLTGKCIPIGIDIKSIPNPPQLQTQIDSLLFFGKLDWLPNKQGLQWFLRNIWPKVIKERKKLQLVIAGKGNSQWLSEFNRLEGIDFRGFVESPAELYSESLMSIVPIFLGSGTRVKVIESCFHARATLSTALGVEGTDLIPGFSYIRAESEEDWINALTQFKREEIIEIGREAFNKISTTFCPRSSAQKFLSLLKESSVNLC